MEKEDWILLCISLGWCGIFAGAAAFNAWRASTREERHPYIKDAISTLKCNKAVVEYVGEPFEVKITEEHSETFAPWKRLVLKLKGPKRSTQAFVCAQRDGYSEHELIDKVDEEEGSLWTRPYLLKQWLVNAISDAWDVMRVLSAPKGTEGRYSTDGIGHWKVMSLFVLAPQDQLPESSGCPKGTPSVISCKGSPEDNPDWYRLIAPEQNTERLFSHWIANSCLLLLCAYSMRRARKEWKMAAQRLSSLRFVSHFTKHHRDLQLLTTRQLQDAVRRSQSRDTSDCVTAGDKHGKAPQVHLRYFTGQLSHEAINGVAHLEIRSRDDTGGDPDIADMLQCELRLQAHRPSPSDPYIALESTLSLIQEPRDAADPPFPVVRTYALDPKALTVPAEA
ncbi:hypothetical protein, conserved [Eimeria tenella]|uniref:Uncharacterized protein n=1 Tax=Eimeria tenella TaxID=5802 RepID=U6L2P7_EIMTE|nr:hypothetical protein, conserved [Eimeria tenella]CDJ43458.1 hypothetical protein, conserved [Eimeria tenella]|eukprot:XP_013234208.1 hypothetical protein, conserved [Eimeria tenella]